MRSDLLLACISGPLLAVFLLKGKARRLLAAVFGGMLIAYFAGAISGFLAELVRYDAMAAVLYISPAVEEGLKLILFLLFLFVCQLEDAALPDVAVGIGVGFAMMESIALQYTAGDIGAIALLLCADSCCLRADAHPGGAHGPPHGAGDLERHSGHLCRNRYGTCAV